MQLLAHRRQVTSSTVVLPWNLEVKQYLYNISNSTNPPSTGGGVGKPSGSDVMKQLKWLTVPHGRHVAHLPYWSRCQPCELLPQVPCMAWRYAICVFTTQER